MTVLTATTAGRPPASQEVLGDGTTAAGRAVRRWRRSRWTLAVGGLVVLVALVLASTLPRGTAGDLDPTSPTPRGAMALAHILTDHGVSVARVTTSGEASTAASFGTTLVVVDTVLLTPDMLDLLAQTQADLVLVEPDALTLDSLAPGFTPAGLVDPAVREPGCVGVGPAQAAGRALAGGHLYAGVGGDATVCYRQPRADAVGSYGVGTADGRTVTVIGQADLLTNAHLAENGNAALAVHTLGRNPQLTWYLPDPFEISDAGQPPTLAQLRPPWRTWVIWQLAVVAGLAMVWRARRLGRLVAEPLPVIVRSAETQEGRARLYRQARARGRAAATLRTAALRRMLRRLDVPAGAGPQAVADVVAGITGRRDVEVRELLLGPAPPTDAALVRIADDLDALERDLAGYHRQTPSNRKARS